VFMPLEVGENSYLSVDGADEILEVRIGASDWAEASPDDKAAALITATRRLEQETYQGAKSDSDQSLLFPRSNLFNSNGDLYADDAIPSPVQLACAELALQLLRDPSLFDDTGLENFSSISKGDSSLTPRGIVSGKLPAQVSRFLRGIRIGNDGGGSAIRA
jgi:hypothetical protein